MCMHSFVSFCIMGRLRAGHVGHFGSSVRFAETALELQRRSVVATSAWVSPIQERHVVLAWRRNVANLWSSLVLVCSGHPGDIAAFALSAEACAEVANAQRC